MGTLDTNALLVEKDAVWLRELAHPRVVVHCADGKVILVPAHELREGASHWKRKSLHVANLLPKARLWPLMAGLLVGKQLVRADPGVRVEVEVHVPAQHNAIRHPGDLEGWSRGQQLPGRGVGLRVGHGGQGGRVGLAREGRSSHPHAAWSHPSRAKELVALRPEGGSGSDAVLERVSGDWLPGERRSWAGNCSRSWRVVV